MITENFDEADITSGNSDLKNFIKNYLLSSELSLNENLFAKELIENFISSTSKMEILGVYGSAMEGGMFSVFNFNSSGDYEFDFDLMVGFGPQDKYLLSEDHHDVGHGAESTRILEGG